MSELVQKHASKRATWWFFYYHFLLYLHFILGIAGVIVGALVAAGGALGLSATNISILGVVSTVSPTAKEDLIEAMTEGYTRIATVQPEALRKYQDATKTVDVSRLSEKRRGELFQRLEELLIEEDAEAEQADKEKALVKVAAVGDGAGSAPKA